MKAEEWIIRELADNLAVRCPSCNTITNKKLNPPIARNVQRLKARGLADKDDLKEVEKGKTYRIIPTNPNQCPNCGTNIANEAPQMRRVTWHGFNPDGSPQPVVEEDDYEIVINQWRGRHNELNTIVKSRKQLAAEYADIIEDDTAYPTKRVKKEAMIERSRARRDGLTDTGFFDRW